MKFEVRTRNDDRAVRAFQVMAAKTVARKKNLIMRAGFAGIGLVFLVSTGVAIYGGTPNTVFRVLGLVLGAAFVVLGLCYTRFAAWQAGRGRRGEVPEIVYAFGEEEFSLSSGGVSEQHEYHEVFALGEGGGYYFLFMDAQTGFILDQKGFTEGDIAAFRLFIEEKTGKQTVRHTF